MRVPKISSYGILEMEISLLKSEISEKMMDGEDYSDLLDLSIETQQCLDARIKANNAAATKRSLKKPRINRSSVQNFCACGSKMSHGARVCLPCLRTQQAEQSAKTASELAEFGNPYRKVRKQDDLMDSPKRYFQGGLCSPR